MRAAGIAIGALLAFAAVNALVFEAGLYRPFLDPVSSAGSFERSIARFAALAPNARRDVLVVGDSRIYNGLDPKAADRAGGRLRFLNGGVPGTTPRCWFFYLRAIDPAATRFRAIVIPVDTYADDDGAIGSIDGDLRSNDLHYIVFRVEPSDIPKLAASFPDPRTRLDVALDLLLRGPLLRDDVQAFAADPRERLDAIGRDAGMYDPLRAHPRDETLAGMRVDFKRNAIWYPPGVSAGERHEMEVQVLRVARPSPSYALYRRRWLAPIVARYTAAGVPVIFVRIPARPLHRAPPSPPSGSMLEFAHMGARLIPQRAYLALERPEFFADHDHLDASGSRRFSELLGRDVARALASGAPVRSAAPPRRLPTPSAPHLLGNVIGIGIPLQFTSYEFWIFFAVVAALFYALPRGYGRFVLLAASYYFYARWNGWYVVFLFGLTASDYAIGLALEKGPPSSRKALLTVGVTANLAFLATFKYANFASGTVAALVHMHQNPWFVKLVVPIGISFHTFQSIAYLVDVYLRRTRAVRDPFDYGLFLAFFPQLLAGPIVRAELFFAELSLWRRPTPDDVSNGLMRVAFGLVKKTAIADQFAAVADSYFGSVVSHPGSPAAWGATFAFAMQIYFDFSGYSDIAIGCARLFGFVFPENFRQPYLATSIGDFWHRWHITLSTWLRDYLYIPLGGNRHGRLDTLRNLLLTMVLGGLWHGAQWTFVAWGGYQGALLCVERLFRDRFAAWGRPWDNTAGGVDRFVKAFVTFTLVCLGWVLFRAQHFGVAIAVYRALFAGGAGAPAIVGWTATLATGIAAFGIVRLAYDRKFAAWQWLRLPAAAQAGVLAGLFCALELFSRAGTTPPFIYFKF